MTAHEEMTKSRLTLEKALVSEDAVAIADAIDTRIKTMILFRDKAALGGVTHPAREKVGRQATCPRCLESIVYKSEPKHAGGRWCFVERGELHTDLACAERCAVMAEKLRDALYEISTFLNMPAQNDPPEIAVPRAVHEHLSVRSGAVEVDGVVYGEHMIRELRERGSRENARAEFERGRTGGVKEAIDLVLASGPNRAWEALVANLKELL